MSSLPATHPVQHLPKCRYNSLRERQTITFAVPFVPEVHHIQLANISSGSFLVQQTSMQQGQPYTVYSQPMQWNDSSAAISAALTPILGNITVTQVSSSLVAAWHLLSGCT